MVPDGATAIVKSQLSGIARSGSLNLAGAVIAALCNFGLVVVVTQNFDQSMAGMLFSATSFFLILLGAGSLGTEAGLARFMLRYQAAGRTADIPTVLRSARTPLLIATFGLAVAAILLAPWIAPLIGLDGESGRTVIVTLAALLPLAAWGDFSLAGSRAFGTVRSTVVVDKILRPVIQPAAAWTVALAGGGFLWLAASWAVPYALAALLSVGLFRRLTVRRGLAKLTAKTPVSQVRREFWAFTWPRGISRICQILLQRSDIVLIAALLGVREAAVYTAATRFVALGQFGVNAIQQVLQPRFSQMLALDQHHEVSKVFKIATSWNMAVAWPIYVIAAAGSAYYLRIFGAGYTDPDARLVVVIMSLAMLFAVTAGPLDTMLLMAGHSRTSLWISLASLATNLGLCFLLIPAWGILGAAVAWAVAVVQRNVCTFFGVRSALSISPFSRAALLVAAAAVVSFGFPILLLTLTGETNFWHFTAVLLVGFGVYVGLLWLWRRPLQLSAFRALRRQPKLGTHNPAKAAEEH